MMENVRKCPRCEVELSFSFFDKKRSGIIKKTCRDCLEKAKKDYKKYYDNNKEIKKEYETKNKEKIMKYREQYLKDNKEYIQEMAKNYRISNIDRIINGKILLHKKEDAECNRLYNEIEYINSDWIKNYLIKCDNTCSICHNGLKLTNYEYLSKEQFSVDRIDNSLAHIKSNCQIICLGCNLRKK